MNSTFAVCPQMKVQQIPFVFSSLIKYTFARKIKWQKGKIDDLMLRQFSLILCTFLGLDPFLPTFTACSDELRLIRIYGFPREI